MTKFLLSIESVLDSFGFTKQRGICGSLRLTPFLRFFPKSGRNQNQKESAMGSLAPGKECGGERYGESGARERVWVGGGGKGRAKKLHFSHFFRAPLFARASPLILSLRSSLFVNGTEKCRLFLRLAT